ncbi:MAG: cytochrome [Phenylobacterium sp.]|nr:cytochrome [Phenylobacterium sp.]
MDTRIRTSLIIAAGAIAFGLAASASSRAEAPPAAPRFTADGKMEFPKDYRSWIYLSTGLDMAYTEQTGMGPDDHMFDSVFVNREAYDAYQKTGHWPDKTVMVLEVRKGAGKGSINKHGQFQTDKLAAEVHVKDEARFKDTGGWAFFGFGGGERPAAKLPTGAGCISCHEAHAAVDTTFVQFYPTLLPIAQAKKTLSAAYLKDEAAGAAVK